MIPFDLYTQYRLETEGENVKLIEKGESEAERVVYTQRSLRREVRQVNTLLRESSAQNSRLIYIAPADNRLLESIDHLNFLWITPPAENLHPFFLDTHTALIKALRDISSDESLQIRIHPALVQITYLQKQLQSLLTEAARRLKTIAHFKNRWEYNFRRNREIWQHLSFIQAVKPQLIIAGGPSLDEILPKIEKNTVIWCADTALESLLYHGLWPDLVFSIDAGHGSFEHFTGSRTRQKLKELKVVLDPMSFPLLYRLPFQKIYSYSSTHPLLQQKAADLPVLQNETADVTGAMAACYKRLFSENAADILKGNEGRVRHFISHVHGSAYHRRSYFLRERRFSSAGYFFKLCRRYH